MMNLTNGEAIFWSKYREEMTYPCGIPHRTAMMLDGQPTLHAVAAPVVKFDRHMYKTQNQKTALGMIEAEQFARETGWTLDQGCLPEVLRELWPKMTRKAKRTICHALVSGKTADEAFSLISEGDLVTELAPSLSDAQKHICPVPGCGLSSEGVGAKAALVAHVRMAHPNWTN